MDHFDRDQDNTIFRLAILGKDKLGRQLYDDFTSEECIVRITDSVDDLIKWGPHTIIVLADEQVTTLHKLIQETDVMIASYVDMDARSVITFEDDYQHLNARERLIHILPLPIGEAWGGGDVSIENYTKVWDGFSKRENIPLAITPIEIPFFKTKLEEFDQLVDQWTESIINDASEEYVMPNKMLRVLKSIVLQPGV